MHPRSLNRLHRQHCAWLRNLERHQRRLIRMLGNSTLSDLFTWRLSCDANRNDIENYGKENNHGSNFCMRMQQTDSVRFYNEPYHKKIASKWKLRSVEAFVQTQQSFCYSQEQWMFRYWWFSASAQAVQSCQFVDAMRSFLNVNGSKSAIRCILRSVSKPTLSVSVCLKSESLSHLKLWSTEMSKQFKACLLFLKFSVSQFIQSQNYWNFSEILICPN